MFSSELFDQCINVWFYTENSPFPIYQLNTPLTGQKPEIKVESALVTNESGINTKVTITNMDKAIDATIIKYLRITMYYKGAMLNPIVNKQMLLQVLYADQVKAPPDRQVCFNCVVPSSSSEIMSIPITIGTVAPTGAIMPLPLTKILTEIIAQYNAAVLTLAPLFAKDLTLLPAPKLKMTPAKKAEFSTIQVAASWTDVPLGQVLTDLSILTKRTEPIAPKNATKHTYIAYKFYVEENQFCVASLPSNNNIPILDKPTLSLDYVLSCYRYGTVIHVRSLFDARISQDTVISLSANALSGKKAAGDLVALAKNAKGLVLFKPVGAIRFAFSTTGENWMELQGTTVE